MSSLYLFMIFWIALSMIFLVCWEINILLITIMVLISLSMLNMMFYYNEMYFFMCENISTLMILLSVFLTLLALLSTPNLKSYNYVFLITFLNFILVMAFMVNNIMMFYIFFEISLIPTLILIIGWGYQPERLQAGMYMMLYTVCASLPLLLFIIFLLSKTYSLNYFLIQCISFDVKWVWIVFMMTMAFLVKLPMYMFHLWLPKAHVEAPLAGSMILAGILLKLGGYGLYLMLKIFNLYILKYEIIFLIVLALWGGLMASFMCLRQTDLKAFVAYSSVAHMSVIIVSVLLNTIWGITSMKIILFTHGFTSPVLFLLAYITYMKSSSRSLFYTKGMLVMYPFLSLIWFLTLSVNMAAPPSINLIGEMLILPVLWNSSMFLVIVMMLLMMFSAIYNMYLYTCVNHGSQNKLTTPKLSLNSNNFLLNFVHMIPLLLLFKSNIILSL